MELERFCAASRVAIVAGKGGVGKTTVTATMAMAAARAGLSVLIVEVEGKSGLAAAFDRSPLTYEEARLASGVRGRTLTPDEALLEYLDAHGLRRVSKRLAGSGALDVVATAVPGMKDILVLGKVKALERAGAADLILIDAPAAGHAVQFLLSARGLLDAVRVGPIRRQAADVVELLSDRERCQVILVSVPEETPVTELIETAYAIEDRAGVALGAVVMNGCIVPLGDDALDELATRQLITADAAGIGLALRDDVVDALARARVARGELVERQREQCLRVARALPLPQIQLPFLFTADVGPAELDTLTDAFVSAVRRLDPDVVP